MGVCRSGDRRARACSPRTRSTACHLRRYVTPLAPSTEPARLTGALVRFTPGARTHWHTHERGQTLYVTEGIGLAASRDGTVTRIRPGDTVTIGAGEEHWHGASATTCVSHLALVTAGDADPTTWLQPVTEEEYAAAQ
jgi:quercetin dioxygenase-like cupin family protein